MLWTCLISENLLMYYIDFYSLFNNPEKDWENMRILDENPPPQLTLFN